MTITPNAGDLNQRLSELFNDFNRQEAGVSEYAMTELLNRVLRIVNEEIGKQSQSNNDNND